MSDYEIEVTLRGPERTVETNYGPRTERDTLARLEVPVECSRGWLLYQQAVQRAIGPDVVLYASDKMTDKDAEALRANWLETHGG